MATVHPEPTASPALIFETLLAYQRSAALRAAIELNLFTGIGDGHGDVASLARRCSASERGIRILCDYLTVIGFLVKEKGHYRHSLTSAAFLDPRSPACVASVAQFLGNSTMTEPCVHLAEIIRSGHTTLPGEGSVEPENPVWVQFAQSMAPMMAPMTAPLGCIVLEGLGGPVRVLDIAAGHGLFGIEIAKQNPKAQIVALDWAPVLEVAKTNAQKAGVADRYSTLAGSAFEADFQGPYDIVLLTNFLHHFDRATCVQLLQKVHAALKPGGRAAALEFVPSEDRISPPFPAMFSMVMLTTTRAGDAYTLRELEAMYSEAGFQRITAHGVSTGPHTVVMGAA
jgi:SAM-dependent methyltransferase